ncbi:MAG TPA: sulfite exporter TauE/SafE family protein [Rhodocyclaceae bacterium]|nr:sulfite exporter TauE/SafE family protein [Rhodocyclaceae bacterium]
MIGALSVFSPATLVCAPLIVLLAYTILGITGFGASITSMPLLAQLLPLRFAVPMLLLLDFSASLIIGTRNRAAIARPELRSLVPFMLLGIALGATFLVHAPAKWLMLGLGVFVLCYAAYSMLAGAEAGPMGRSWAAPLGTLGGIFSALFGTGGPVYAIYLARRLPDKSALRATIATVITLSAISRLGVFALAGLYAQRGMLAAAAGLFPFMLAGLWLGNRLHHRLAAKRVQQGLWLILIAGGVSLVARSLLA